MPMAATLACRASMGWPVSGRHLLGSLSQEEAAMANGRQPLAAWHAKPAGIQPPTCYDGGNKRYLPAPGKEVGTMNQVSLSDLPQPIIYPESDGLPMADNTKQMRW